MLGGLHMMKGSNQLNEARWSIGELDYGDSIVVVKWRSSLSEFTQKSSFPVVFGICCESDADKNNGMPSKAEFALLQTFEAGMRVRLESNGHCILAFVRTGLGKREWVFYTADGEQAWHLLADLPKPPHCTSFYGWHRDDPEWRDFTQIVDLFARS
jgi:hypothetical protein